METVIRVQHVPAHFNKRAGCMIPECWVAEVIDGREDEIGIQSRWHDREGAIDGAVSELRTSSRQSVAYQA